MTNFSRYLYGFMIGMCAEYLLRVKYSPYPVILIALMTFIIILDLLSNKSPKLKELTPTPPVVDNDPSPWIRFEDEKPPHEVVLVACDTSDCGWVIDSAWWYEDNQCWMTTGAVESREAHLPYSHWRRLPKTPDQYGKK